MDKFDRIFELHRFFSKRRTPASHQQIAAHLHCSKATVYRLIELMRDRLDAPLVQAEGGWMYDRSNANAIYNLPGLWFSADELLALLSFHRLLQSLEPGLLDEQLAPFGKRLEKLIAHRHLHLQGVERRIRVLALASRPAGEAFRTIASATLQRRRLAFRYHSRGKDEITTREVSPQRLTHYRDNWYLDGWDHGKDKLLSFSVDRISGATIGDDIAIDLPEAELDAVLGSAYGIFSGVADKEAVLRFSAERARWVADERWHPKQSGRWLEDGRYELRIPYRDARELVMDVLRHGAEVEVVGPDGLRKEVARQLRVALGKYDG